MTTVSTPITGTVVVEMVAGDTSPTPIPHATSHTVVIAENIQNSPNPDNEHLELPTGAAIGDLVEIYSIRPASGNNGGVNVYPASGETIRRLTTHVGGAEFLFRKISATEWRVLVAK